MQTPLCSLSLSVGLFNAKSTKELAGITVPWEVTSYEEDYATAQIQGGFFDLSSYAVISIVGPDATDYLHRMSTVNFKTFDSNKIVEGAFLTGKGGVISLGLFQKVSEGAYHYLASPGQREAVLEHLEKFHFAEKLEIKDLSSEFVLFALWKPTNDLRKDMVCPPNLEPRKVEWRRWSLADIEFWQDFRRPEMLMIKTRRNQAPLLLKEWRNLGVQLLGHKLYDYYRIQSGLPEVGTELHDTDIILEGNVEEAVARNKGCYPGQEVVERIFTYGQVNRKLYRVNLSLSGHTLPELPLEFKAGEKPVGQLVSSIELPGQKENAVGLMYLKKEFWDQTGPWNSQNGVQATKG